jgi:hypothetical protein
MIMLLNNIFLLCFRYFLKVSKYGIKKVTTMCRSWAKLSVFRVGFSNFCHVSKLRQLCIILYRTVPYLIVFVVFYSPPPIPDETVGQAGR